MSNHPSAVCRNTGRLRRDLDHVIVDLRAGKWPTVVLRVSFTLVTTITDLTIPMRKIIADHDQAGRVRKQRSTVDTRFVDLIKAPIGPAFSDNSTGNPGRPAATNLTHVPLT